MAFADQLQLSPDDPTAVATNLVDYDLASYNGSASTRRVPGLDLDEPQVLTISHETVKSSGVKRHLVRFDSVQQDATDPTIVGTISVYAVIVVPPVVSTEALVEAEVNKLANLLAASGVVTKLLNEEI